MATDPDDPVFHHKIADPQPTEFDYRAHAALVAAARLQGLPFPEADAYLVELAQRVEGYLRTGK